MPSVMDWIFGSKDKLKKIPTGTQQQQDLHNQILSQAMNSGGYQQANDYFSKILQGGPEAFNEFASPYMNQFEEQVLPQIAERFAGGGALSSSGFGQAIGGAASSFQAQLAQMFSNMQNQAAQSQYNQFNQMSNTGLNYQPFAYQQQQGSGGILIPALTAAASAYGGPMAASAIGGISSLFKKQPEAGSGSSSGKFGLPTFLNQ